MSDMPPRMLPACLKLPLSLAKRSLPIEPFLASIGPPAEPYESRRAAAPPTLDGSSHSIGASLASNLRDGEKAVLRMMVQTAATRATHDATTMMIMRVVFGRPELWDRRFSTTRRRRVRLDYSRFLLVLVGESAGASG